MADLPESLLRALDDEDKEKQAMVNSTTAMQVNSAGIYSHGTLWHSVDKSRSSYHAEGTWEDWVKLAHLIIEEDERLGDKIEESEDQKQHKVVLVDTIAKMESIYG